MSKTSFVLTLLFFVFSAQADTYNCDYQEQFILGNQNLFVKEFKISKCNSSKKYQTEDQACDCANKNKPIIGPNRSDSEKVKKELAQKNQEQIEELIKKHMLTIIDDFTMIEGKFVVEEAAKACSLKRIEEIKCANENSILKSLDNNTNFLSKLVISGQCEIEAQFGATQCSNGQNRLREVNQTTCLNEVMIKKIKAEQLEGSFHELILALKSNDMNLSTFDSFKSHPLISQLFTNQELKQEFLQSISSIPIQAEKNQQLLEMLSSNTLLPQFTQGIKSNCEQRIEKFKSILCLDSSRLSDITKEEVEANLTNRNLPLKKEDPNFKQYRRENFLTYQHELSFYCENTKDKEKLITEQKNLTALLPRQMQSLSTRSVIQKYADEIRQFEKNFCPLLSSNESKHKLDDLLSANSCPGAANCKMLESYIAMMAQNEGIQDETGQFVFSSKMTMSPQLKTIYGIQEGEQGPTIQTRTFTAYNDSPVVKDLTTTTQSFFSNSASRRSSSSTSEKSAAPQFDNVTITGTSTNSDTNYYQNHGKNSKKPIVRRVSRSTSSSGNTKTKDETINKKESSYLGRPTVRKRVVTRDKSKIEQQVDELKDEMIDNLSEQLKEMRNLASKAIDINNQFAPSSTSNFIGEVPSRNYVAPANNQYNGQINTNRNIDKIVPSNIIATGQGKNPTSNTRVPSSTGGSQAAVVNVRPSTQSSSKNSIDEIEVTFKPGEKPALLLLQDEDYNKIITYLKDKKTFILTKKFNLAGTEETFSAQITPINNGKYEIEVLNKDLDKKVSKEKLTALQNEIIEALKIASKDNPSSNEISLRLD